MTGEAEVPHVEMSKEFVGHLHEAMQSVEEAAQGLFAVDRIIVDAHDPDAGKAMRMEYDGRYWKVTVHDWSPPKEISP